MKKLVSLLLVLVLVLAALPAAAFADSDLSRYSNREIQQLYEAIRQEMISRGLPLQKDITLREGQYVVGEDIQPGTYTVTCTETFGDTYGGLYSSLGELYGGSDSPLGGLMGSLGGMMGDIVNAEVEIIGDYGRILKSYELKAGESIRLTLSENTALQITDGSCTLTAD